MAEDYWVEYIKANNLDFLSFQLLLRLQVVILKILDFVAGSTMTTRMLNGAYKWEIQKRHELDRIMTTHMAQLAMVGSNKTQT